MAPRKRSGPDKWMPPRVYRGKSAFEWHPREGGAVRLCDLDAKESEVWAAYEKATADTKRRFDLDALARMYFDAPEFTRLKPNTRDDYLRSWKILKDVFGQSLPGTIQPADVRRYMDLRGKASTVRANRERSLLSNVMAWGYERGLVKSNPCVGVRTFSEPRRERYITDHEYQAVLAVASPNIQAAMEIAYRCAARQQDVLALLRQQLLPEGVYIKQGKTGKQQIKAWTQELRAAVDLAIQQPSKIATTWVIHNRDGQRYTRGGFSAMWKRLIIKAVADGIISEPFTFHDLKRKGISDFEGDKQQFSGHATPAMAARYNVKPEVVPTIGTPQKPPKKG